jgi:glycosyltransferase involved in cell wall biosynthesis
MRVCYFGAYDKNSLRNINNIKALRKVGVDVVECYDRTSPLFLRYSRLIKKHKHLNYDVMVIGWYGHSILPLARCIAKGPIVLDAFIGLYETEVLDRKNVSSKSWKAKLYYYLDKYHFHFADMYLSDTNCHIEYFHKEYKVKRDKFRTLYVTTDDEFYYPRKSNKDDTCFSVLFQGGFTPLHGVQYIVKAAKLLENQKDIKFELIGTGQTYESIKALCGRLKITNISFLPWMNYYTQLPNRIAAADICLGIFADNEKAKRVIPTKAVDALAMQKPLITGDSPAASEILVNMENSLLVPMANPEALADAIVTLKEDPTLRIKIAENGYRLFKEKLCTEVIGKDLKLILTEIVERSK